MHWLESRRNPKRRKLELTIAGWTLETTKEQAYQSSSLKKLLTPMLTKLQKRVDFQKQEEKGRLYQFGKGHPLERTHVQYLKSKQPTLIFTGQGRPSHSGLPPQEKLAGLLTMAQQREYTEIYKAWKQKADAFAIYYLVSFRPELNVYSIDHTNTLAYDWEALCEWMCHLESQEVIIAKARFSALVRHVWILFTKNSHRNMMSAYRMRNRTVWSQIEKDEAKDLFEKTNNRVRQARGNEQMHYAESR
jgi:hypothetical protein